MEDIQNTHKGARSDWLLWLQWIFWSQWRSQDLCVCCGEAGRAGGRRRVSR